MKATSDEEPVHAECGHDSVLGATSFSKELLRVTLPARGVGRPCEPLCRSQDVEHVCVGAQPPFGESRGEGDNSSGAAPPSDEKEVADAEVVQDVAIEMARTIPEIRRALCYPVSGLVEHRRCRTLHVAGSHSERQTACGFTFSPSDFEALQILRRLALGQRLRGSYDTGGCALVVSESKSCWWVCT